MGLGQDELNVESLPLQRGDHPGPAHPAVTARDPAIPPK